MKTACTAIAGVPVIIAFAGPAALAQLVAAPVPVAPVQVGNPQFFYNETAIAASRTSPGELLAAAVQRIPENVVVYAISIDGGVTWAPLQTFRPPSSCFSVTRSSDPWVASDAAGNLYLSGTAYSGTGIGIGGVQGVFVGLKPIGLSSITSVVPATPCPVTNPSHPFLTGDRGRIAFGPGPSQTPEYGLIGYYRLVLPQIATTPYSVWSPGSGGGALGLTWSDPRRISLTAEDFLAGPTQVSIVQVGSEAGRAVACIQETTGDLIVFISEDRGNAWHRGPTTLTTLNSYWNPAILNAEPFSKGPVVGGDPRGQYTADISADPNVADTVFVVTCGVTSSDPGNTDIFLFRSQNGGETFPATQRLRLTDALLGHPAGSDQFFAAVHADEHNGINLLYYHSEVPDTSPTAALDAYYVRIKNFSATNPSQMSIAKRRLTPSTFTVPVPPATDGYIGEYQAITASGCRVYACYMSTHDSTYNFYVQRITLLECPRVLADFDGNEEVNAADVVAYAAAFAEQAQQANLDADELVTIADFQLYQQAYTAATSAP